MSDVSAEDVQNLRQLRYEEMQKMKSQLKEQDQKWQDVSMLCIGRWEDWASQCTQEVIFLAMKEFRLVENVTIFL